MLSILIVNWNTCALLRECLASIEAYPPTRESLEVIVVDNASWDGSAEMVRTEFPDVHLIANDTNVSYAAGNNQALEASRGETLLFLNPDVVLHPTTLPFALEFLRSRPDAGAVGIKQLMPDGRIQRSLRGFPKPLPLFWEMFGFSRIFPRSKFFGAYRMTYFDYESEGEADQPMGTFLLFPRAVYEKVGGLDTNFPLFFNDTDWCYRVKQAGWKIYYTPLPAVLHYGASGTRQKPRAETIRESHRSLLRFYDKHYRKSMPMPLYGLIRAMVIASATARTIPRLAGRKKSQRLLTGPTVNK